MSAGYRTLIILIGLSLCFAAAALAVRRDHAAGARRTVVLRAVAGSIGTCSLAMSREGGPTREPLEGPAGCLGDIPAGYCLRDSCDVVTSPGAAGRPVVVEVVRDQIARTHP